MSFKRILKKSILLLSLFFAILAITESILWLANKKNQNLFIETGNGEFLNINRNFISQFANQSNIEYLASKKITKQKGNDTYRIFVVGEVLNPEMPNNPNSNFAHQLNLMLQRTFSHRDIELVNIAYDSASSFEMVKTVEQIKNYEPDLVILCPGRNEFYGKNTLASNSITGNEKLDRFVQNTNIYQAVKKHFINQNEVIEIEANGPVFQNTIERFENNLDKMVLDLQNKNIPIILVNTANNLLDEAPQKSRWFSSPASGQLQRLFDEGKKAYTEGNYNLAYSCFSKVYRKDMTHAETLYYLGKLALKENKLKDATGFLRQAADYDLIKSRAPSAINNAIFRIATIRNCTLIDLEKALSQNALTVIPGSGVFMGKSHLTLKGNAILASVCAQAILKDEFLGKNDTINKNLYSVTSFIPFDTIYDQMVLSKTCEHQFLSVPSQVFTSFEEQIASLFANNKNTWEESMNKLYEYYIKNKNYKLAFKVIENLVLENPYKTELNDKASQTAALLGDSQLVVHYASRVYKANPDPILAERLFISYLKLDKPECALPFIEFARKQKFNNKEYNFIYTATNQIIDLKKILKKSPANPQILHKIASLYSSIGNEDVVLFYSKSAPLQEYN